MKQRTILHIVDGSSSSRAEQARMGHELGYHCEIYADVGELMSFPPRKGVVLARDDKSSQGVIKVLRAVSIAEDWIPVIGTSIDPDPGDVVAAEVIDTGGPAGFIAQVDADGTVDGTDASWKVVSSAPAGWEQPGFDDSSWDFATSYGAYGVGPWCERNCDPHLLPCTAPRPRLLGACSRCRLERNTPSHRLKW